MDNNRKIEALMVYFDHWGIEEAQKHRRHQGILLLSNKMHQVFFEDDGEDHTTEELAREIRLFNTWTSMSNPKRLSSSPFPLWRNIIDVLLDSMGGYPFVDVIKPTHESIVSRNVHMKVWTIYDMCLSDEDLMSVDSIVALL